MQREIRCCDHPRYGKCDCGAEGIPAPPTNERKECCEKKCAGCKECLDSAATTGEQCVQMRDCPCHQSTSLIEEIVGEIAAKINNSVHDGGWAEDYEGAYAGTKEKMWLRTTLTSFKEKVEEEFLREMDTALEYNLTDERAIERIKTAVRALTTPLQEKEDK